MQATMAAPPQRLSINHQQVKKKISILEDNFKLVENKYGETNTEEKFDAAVVFVVCGVVSTLMCDDRWGRIVF